jgi:hypothetical protein
MIIGGKRAHQRGDHQPLKVSDYIKDQLEPYNVFVNLNLEWPSDRVDLFLANHTINKLFQKYKINDSSQPLIEKYNFLF